jgi:hypothetical protein
MTSASSQFVLQACVCDIHDLWHVTLFNEGFIDGLVQP